MPRTKRSSKKRNYSNVSTSSQSSDGKCSMKSNQNNLMIADINRNFDAQMLKFDKQLENSIALLKRAYDMVILKIPTAMLNKPLRDCVPDRTSESSSNSPMVSSTIDHLPSPKGQENQPKRLPQQNAPVKHNTRNSSKDSGHGDEQTFLMPAPAHNRFRTPNCNIGAGGRYNAITPKMQPNSVLSVLRRPREGEMAVSMSGSPLLVSSTSHENMANVNVPLPNGLVMSILPQAGLRPHDMPEMDKETMKQLKQLKDNLASFLNEEF